MTRRITILTIIIFILGLLFIVNPEHSVLLPKCAFYMLTGWECPACGTQRAIYHFLHFDLYTAFSYNPFLIISMPYVLALVITTWFDPKNKLIKLKQMCYHPVIVRVYLVLIVAWWVGRNIGVHYHTLATPG